MTSLLLKKGKLGHQLHVMSMDGLLVLIPLLVLYFLTFMESWDQPFVGYTSVLKGPHLFQRLKKKNTVRISTQELCTKSDGVQVCLLDDRNGHLNGVVFVGDQPLDEVKDDKALPSLSSPFLPHDKGAKGTSVADPQLMGLSLSWMDGRPWCCSFSLGITFGDDPDTSPCCLRTVADFLTITLYLSMSISEKKVIERVRKVMDGLKGGRV